MPLRSLDRFTSAGQVVASLQKGETVSTDVLPTGTASYVYLTEGDECCGLCGDLITGKDYPGAGYANVLGNMKHQYGDTACAECLPQLKAAGSESESADEDPDEEADKRAASAD